MLIKMQVENFKSFDHREEISMISSSKIQAKKAHRVKIKQTGILKNAVIYGANASGKSNLVEAISFFKSVLLEGLSIQSVNDFCRNREENKDRESFFELQFTVGDSFYAYGFSAILSQRRITEEWLYGLTQDGNAHQLFSREGNQSPVLGNKVKLNSAEQSRFHVYSEDFVGHETQLFLTEMNRGKKYSENSKLLFFPEVFRWLMDHIIVITPYMGISNSETYFSEESLETISRLIRTFDTGVSEIRTRRISAEEMEKMTPPGFSEHVFAQLKQQMQQTNRSDMRITWRARDSFFTIRVKENAEPEISALVLRHGRSAFEFSFADESDGTKRLFDLIDMLVTDRPDTVFVVDELERSLHPKLTEHFLKLFLEAHAESRMQLIFTTHENSLMDLDLFRRDEIWFIERGDDDASSVYSLDRFKERYDKKLSKAYLEGHYGAIPVFREFTFRKGI